LEPLSAAEIEASAQLIKKLPEFNSAARFISIMLKPSGFFDQNPTNDVPPSKSAGEGKKCCPN